jgi:two-component system chemotaxis sensor kinase CheA
MGVRSEIEANFDFEIVDEFLDHYALMVDSMELLILDLAKENMYRRSVEELFRVFHNIKSASGFLHIEPIRKLAAFVEEVLEELRQKEGPANDDTINWLLSISDMFAAWQNDLQMDNTLTPVKFSLLKIPDIDK